MKNSHAHDHNDQSERDKEDIVKLSTLTILILIILSLLYSGCYYSCDDYSYIYYEPVYADLDSIRSSISFDDPKEIEQPGALYYKDGYVLVNESGEGIHIIDDRDPTNPVATQFISIPGNFSLAAKGDFMYADSYMDLLVFDISDFGQVKLLSRHENVFEFFGNGGVYLDHERRLIVDYTETVMEERSCETRSFFGGMNADDGGVALSNDRGVNAETGEAGSMARFVVDGETLYTVDYTSMNVFDITTADQPQAQGRIDMGWGIETIFPYQDKLFIGAVDGMYIYDNTDQLSPQLLSKYEHTTSCDPVVVQGNYAYVTLRDGTECEGFINQLDIVDVSDATNPRRVKTYPMLNPHGLDVNGTCLFICEGQHGLKSFQLDSGDPTLITETQFYENVDAFDVISLPNVLLMVGQDGFFQYDYNCGGELLLLSKIEF